MDHPRLMKAANLSRIGYTSRPWPHCLSATCFRLADLFLSPGWSCLQGTSGQLTIAERSARARLAGCMSKRVRTQLLTPSRSYWGTP